MSMKIDIYALGVYFDWKIKQ